MAITPRTIFTNPASAVVTAASLFALTAAGMYAYNMSSTGCHFEEAEEKVEAKVIVAEQTPTACDSLRESLSHDKSSWSEFDWFQYASCFDKHNDSRQVIEVTTHGLNYYPSSEALYNLKGYHQISLGEHEAAVKTLETGLRRVGATSSGTMTNNLAWAGLWVPREMELHRARALYRRSMSREAGVCESIHTGMWVEYAIASQSRGLERAQALRAFHNLREQYEPCVARYDDGERDKLIEVLGAAVIAEDLDRELRSNALLHKSKPCGSDHALTLVAKELRRRHRGASIDALCREAVPMASAHHTCVEMIDQAVTTQRRIEMRRR